VGTPHHLAVLLLLVPVACARPEAPEPPAAPEPAPTRSDAPLARLAALDLDLADTEWKATCHVEVTTAEGDLVARLDEEAHARFTAGGAFDVELVHRSDNRYQRGVVDSMRAVLTDGVLAVRRQAEPFARVANLHGEAARYREVGLGLFPALVSGFAADATREGDRLRLIPVDAPATPRGEARPALNDQAWLIPVDAPATPRGEARPALNDQAWVPAFRAALSNVAGQGSLTWAPGAGRPSEGSLNVTAALNGQAFRAECALAVAPLPKGTRLEAPASPISLDRPRAQRDLNLFLRRLEGAPVSDEP